MCADRIVALDTPLPIADRLAVRRMKRWKPGRTLGVRFLDGDPKVHARVAKIASTWMDHANVRLEFDNRGDAEIRVAFTPGASWSAVGIDALDAAPGTPTVNFGWLTPTATDDEYERVVLHEFGHVLGCIHEHQSPAAEIPWNRPAVYAYYGEQGWTPAQVDTNIFETYSEKITQFSDFDPASIMIYPIDPGLLTDPARAVPWNTKLSPTDVEFIGTIYPRVDATLPRLELGADPLAGEIETEGQVDVYRFDVTLAGDYVVETSGPTDLALVLLGPDSEHARAGADPGGGGLGGNARVAGPLEPGTYLARVAHQRAGGWGRYAISLRDQI